MEVAEPVSDDGFRIFNDPMFGDVRTIEEDGKVLFCGLDVAKALGYSRPRDAVSDNTRYAVKHRVPQPALCSSFLEMLTSQLVSARSWKDVSQTSQAPRLWRTQACGAQFQLSKLPFGYLPFQLCPL